ncbi:MULTISPECIES: tetratricopeptide repeat protein [Mesorhizobium]|uniref:Tetratricopeptide repeat protein n=2 Tax=Mesorhizobium TaxID=68287 RepID=A0A1A5I851_RHILI|nr:MULTISPECIES: tetratricopeptide repeat protein [Mesorhizobium]ETA72382.1 Tfp pilus assembly protein PilF [Mesorhizobium japonicum R7A]MBE1709709.1 tetratricopeptide repeat protein [Mesorhizobium japonicum]MBE1714378.1 tetratricopeptide repeat protein [Mesorhizobium japonicum]MUT21991.1 tetratricopeptide repeat protein [Mesorhizobium japonicum]MUT28588.1 tetratricopeptide repeat protein [Mesorhizobium japonicum]
MTNTNQVDSGDLIRRAVAAFNSGNHGQAMQLCELGLKQHPDDPALCHLLAAVLFARVDLSGARTHIETSLAARADNVPALILACKIARADGRFEAALQQLDRAAKLSSQAEIPIERARTLDQAGNALAAREWWTLVLQRDPKSEEAAARLGRLAWQRGASVEAEGFLERAVASGGHPSAWFDLGLVRQDMRKFGAAAQAYRRVLEMSPDAPEAAVNLGVVLQETGDLDGAMLAYSTAYRLRPSTFGVIAMALTSAPSGRLWLDEEALRRSLARGAPPPGAKPLAVDTGR